jgi:hypothetical protein
VEKPVRDRSKNSSRLKDITQINFKEIPKDCTNWIYLAKDMDNLEAVFKRVIKCRVPEALSNFLIK